MMPRAGCAAAYLVMSYLMTASGELVEEGATVCFDFTLALEMAEADSASVAGACVFALDARGEIVNHGALAAFGLFEPGARAAFGATTRPSGASSSGARPPDAFRLS